MVIHYQKIFPSIFLQSHLKTAIDTQQNIQFMQNIKSNIHSQNQSAHPNLVQITQIKEITQQQQVSNVLLRIDLRKKLKQMIVNDVAQKLSIGPFQIEAGISGDYNFLTRKGFITCRLNVIKPFTLKQKLYLVDSLLRLKYEMSILQLLSSFGLPSDNQLTKYFDIKIIFQLTTSLIQKNWGFFGSLQTKQQKFTFFNKDFGIQEIGYKISGKKGQIEENKVYFIFKLDTIPLKLEHLFGKEYLFEGYLEAIPFGKLISNLTDGIDALDISSVLSKFELRNNWLKFKNFSNFIISSECQIGNCQITVNQGKFSSSFTPPKDFKFITIAQQLQFFDYLGMNQIKIEANNLKQKFKIEGALIIEKIEPLAKLVDMLSSNLSKSLILPFALIITSWTDISISLGFLKNLQINEAITLKALSLLIRPSSKYPEFGIQGEILAKICDTDFDFKVSMMVGVITKLTAQMTGIWDEPFGLKNSYVKDLVLQITPSGFAVKGQIKLGEMKAEAAVSFDLVYPTRNMIYFKLESFQFGKVLSVFGVEIPKQIANILNQINIKKMQVMLVPPGGVRIGDTQYAEGFSSKLDCEIFGFKAKYQLEYKKDKFSLFGQIDPIEIPHIFKLKSLAHDQKGPSFDVKLGLSASSHLRIDGLISVLDLIDRQIYAEADAQGITFYTRSALKIFGLDFMEGSFKFMAGLLRINDGFSIQASFKTDDKVIQIIQKKLREEAINVTKPFEQAKKKLEDVQAKFQEEKIFFDQIQERHRNESENAKKEFDRIFNQHQKQASAVFIRQRTRATQVLNNEKKRARQEMQNAKNQALKKQEDQKKRAKEQLDNEKNRASAQLQSKKSDLENALRGPREKVQSLNSTIREYQKASILQFWKRAAVPGLILARESAQIIFNVAQATYNAGLDAAKSTYKGILSASQTTFSTAIQASKLSTDLALSAAEKTYEAAIQAATATYNQTLKSIQNTYDAALKAATQVANKAQEAYIAGVELAFKVAKQALSAANLAVIMAKSTLEQIKHAVSYAINFLASLINGLGTILMIKKVFFLFDLNSQIAKVGINITILGQQLTADMLIKFGQVADFINLLAERIWQFISGH